MNQQQDKMKEASRGHTQLFLDALDRAMTVGNGVWVNSKSSGEPKFYMRTGRISAFSSLLMAMHSQLQSSPLNTYISYADAKAKNIRFGDYNSGVQVPYIRQDGYRNRLSNRLITDAEFKALSPEQASSYRPNFQRALRMAYNIEQTNFKQLNPQGYSALIQGDGPEKGRGIDSLEKECDDLTDFDDNCALYERHMVGLMPTEDERTHYDPKRDMVVISCLASYPSTDAFLQDGFRAMAAATGHPSRLNRDTSTDEAMIYEKLVQECVSAMRMAQMGRTGAISDENMALIPKWREMLATNPRMIFNLERDVNLTQEMLLKAEANEKIVVNIKPQPRQTDMPVEDMLALKDILRYGGMMTNPANFSSAEAYRSMLEKYGLGELHTSIEQCHGLLRDNESLKAQGKISEDSYMLSKSDLYKELSKLGVEMTERIVTTIPRPWDYYGRRYVSNEIERLVLDEREELILIHDPENKIINVLLPSDVRFGGTAVTAKGEKVDFWLDPLEQLTPEELKDATITRADPDWCDKKKVAESLKEKYGAKYVRFFETQGPLGFYPPNDYFIGKEMSSAKIVAGAIPEKTRDYLIQNIVRDTCAMDFESISVIKDDNGAWVMNMQTKTGENLSLYPTQEDLKIFFTRCRDLTEDSLATKKELAQKYYNLALEDPRLKVDIFNQIPQGIDPECIARVYIYKDPKFGVQMIKPTIRGLDDVSPRSITKSQFQKLWLAPNPDEYRKALACRVFSDIIPKQYNIKPKEDNSNTEQRETFVGIISKSYAEQIAALILSVLNTSETNRYFRKENSPAQKQSNAETESQSGSESKSQSQSESQSESESKSQSNSDSEAQSQSESHTQFQSQPKSDSNSDSHSQSDEKSQTQDSSQSQTQEQNNRNSNNQKQYANRVNSETQNSQQSQGQNKPRYQVPEDISTSTNSYDERDSQVNEPANGKDNIRSQPSVPYQYSQPSPKTDDNNKVKESGASYSAVSQPSSEISGSADGNKDANEGREEKDKSSSEAQTAEKTMKQSASDKFQAKDIMDVTVSVEMLNHYKKLRRMYPDAFIIIAEDGKAKALHDNAFEAYDIIHDGHPVVFVPHPLSESPKDNIPVFEIPESQVEGQLHKIMKRNTSIIFSRLEDELNLDTEKGFRLGI